MRLTAEETWNKYKDTPCFKREILELAKQAKLCEGEIEVLQTTWGDSPIEVEMHFDKEIDAILVKPVFMGNTLDTVPIIIHPDSLKTAPARQPRL